MDLEHRQSFSIQDTVQGNILNIVELSVHEVLQVQMEDA